MAEIRVELERWKGYSAYEIAVQHGFVGTEAEWLNYLRGDNMEAVNIANNLITEEQGWALDARQGRVLKILLDEKQDELELRTVALPASGWANLQQTVAASGVTAESKMIVSAAPSSYQAYVNNMVYCSAQGEGTLTFTCKKAPVSDLTAQIIIWG